MEEHTLKSIQKFAQLNVDERIKTIIILGESGDFDVLYLLKYAILQDSDIHVKFSALKRLHHFKEHPELKSMLDELIETKANKQLEPYFSMALVQLGLMSISDFEQKMNQ